MGDPSSSDVHTDGVSTGFTCSSCGKPMANWKNGSKCAACKAADKPDSAFVKAGKASRIDTSSMDMASPQKSASQGTTAKPGGKAQNVQDEFPKCPSCGTPTKDGAKCADCKKTTERDHKVGDLTVAQQEAQARSAEADAKEEDDRRTIRGRARQVMAEYLGLDKDVKKAAASFANQPPTVLKSSNESRFSYAPMYMPGVMDAHNEFVKSADDLQRATWEYVRKSGADRTVYLQHIDRPAGEWVEITSWPYAVEAPMTMPGTGEVRKANLPAGTVYMGVIWEPWAWDLVQKGKLLGFSMGGWAKRVQGELLDDVTKAKAFGPAGEPREAYDPEVARQRLGL